MNKKNQEVVRNKTKKYKDHPALKAVKSGLPAKEKFKIKPLKNNKK